MKRLSDIGTRRHVIRATAAGIAAAPLLAGKSTDALGSDRDDDRDHDRGHRGGACCCLLKGTRVATPAGERAVENLLIGDEVLTLSGPRAVKWIGYDKYTRSDHRPWQARVIPIRVVRSAIADQAPHSDLYLSPAHRVFVNEVLIPVRYLVNGATIAPAAPQGTAAIEYYHIELHTHEVLFAEGAPVESFMEEDSEREFFSNFVEYERLYGRDEARMTPFAPILDYRNRSQRLAGLARSIVSSLVDVRDPIQVARDQLARRADALPV
jgi:hypothetical protein